MKKLLTTALFALTLAGCGQQAEEAPAPKPLDTSMQKPPVADPTQPVASGNTPAAADIAAVADAYRRSRASGAPQEVHPRLDYPPYRSSVLRMHVAATAQGQGVGTYAVGQVADEAKRRGFEALYAVWEPGELGPSAFFTAIGFEVVGETEFGDQIGRRAL